MKDICVLTDSEAELPEDQIQFLHFFWFKLLELRNLATQYKVNPLHVAFPVKKYNLGNNEYLKPSYLLQFSHFSQVKNIQV